MRHEVHVLDMTDREAVDHRPLAPVLVPKAVIEAEIERLSKVEMTDRRRSVIVHPGLAEGFGFMPACTVSINVLLPGERTKPHRHNSSVVNFALRGGGTSLIAGTTIEFSERDTWSTPPWATHQHINDTDDVQVRLSYSNSGLLDRLYAHITDDADGLDPHEPLGDPERTEALARGEVLGEDGASLLTYEELISPDPPYQKALLWAWPRLEERLYDLKETKGKEYEGRRLFLMYDPTTGRTQGTSATFFATMAILPPGQRDVPHRHSSAAINYYFSGTGFSIVGGERYEWEAGDLMLSAPGWMPHGHAAYDEDVLVLTIQDSPLQIALGSLLWMENIKVGRTEALGVTKGFRAEEAPATVG